MGWQNARSAQLLVGWTAEASFYWSIFPPEKFPPEQLRLSICVWRSNRGGRGELPDFPRGGLPRRSPRVCRGKVHRMPAPPTIGPEWRGWVVTYRSSACHNLSFSARPTACNSLATLRITGNLWEGGEANLTRAGLSAHQIRAPVRRIGNDGKVP